MNEVKELSDTNLTDNILNIGRRRERRIYYRPDGIPTGPLPADTYSQIAYMKKGFTLSPGKKDVEVTTIRCPYCDFEPKSAFGLQAHLKIHVNKSNEKEET